MKHLRNRLSLLPGDWIVLPGHQYELSDGTNPTFITVKSLLTDNEALNALDSDETWDSLEFLSFDDSLAEKARREKARLNID